MNNKLLLVADIGNTHTVFGIYSDGRLLRKWRITSHPDLTPDELASTILPLLPFSGIDADLLTHAAIASVVPPLEKVWKEFCNSYIGVIPLVVNQDLKVPLKIRYRRPHEVGADRLVNAYAAFRRFQTSLIVVDYGTATTFDCVSQKGEYLGGAIAPGLLLGAEALSGRTAKLPRIDINAPLGEAIAQDTESAIRNGIIWGHVGLTKEMLQRLRQELPDCAVTIATGGLAPVIKPFCPEIEEVMPDLTLLGLAWILDGGSVSQP